MKTYKDFINEGSEKLWIYEGDFKVTEKMVEYGMMIKNKIPDIIKGDFDCSNLKLTTLKNCPEKVNGDFHCHINFLTNLEFCPKEINGDFDCDANELTSLEYCPEKIDGHFICSQNKLTSLKGCPEEINGDFWCYKNLLTSLEFSPKKGVKKVECDDNVYSLSIEEGFVKKGYTDYWKDLYHYCKDNNISLIDIKTWPTEFINTLNEEDKRLLKSGKGVDKFGL